MENIWGVPSGPDWQHLPAEAVQNGALHSILGELIRGAPCSGPLGPAHKIPAKWQFVLDICP